ncbi:hypothetical protein AB9F45_39265, partial [Rhizobium leguminosarum]
GHGGGWTLVRPLSDITLLDVYNAIGEPHLFAIGPADDQIGIQHFRNHVGGRRMLVLIHVDQHVQHA